jgi:hypothetical protein
MLVASDLYSIAAVTGSIHSKFRPMEWINARRRQKTYKRICDIADKAEFTEKAELLDFYYVFAMYHQFDDDKSFKISTKDWDIDIHIISVDYTTFGFYFKNIITRKYIAIVYKDDQINVTENEYGTYIQYNDINEDKFEFNPWEMMTIAIRECLKDICEDLIFSRNDLDLSEGV